MLDLKAQDYRAGDRRGRAGSRRDPEGQGPGGEVRRSCAPASTRRRSSCGRSSATCSTTAPSTWQIDRRQRARRRPRDPLGLRLERWARSRPGRPRAGSRSPSWIAEDIVAGKAMSERAAAGLGVRRPRGRARRRGQLSARRKNAKLPRSTLPVYGASAFPIRCSARRSRPGDDRLRERRRAHVARRRRHRRASASRPRCTPSATTCSTACSEAIDVAETRLPAAW